MAPEAEGGTSGSRPAVTAQQASGTGNVVPDMPVVEEEDEVIEEEEEEPLVRRARRVASRKVRASSIGAQGHTATSRAEAEARKRRLASPEQEARDDAGAGRAGVVGQEPPASGTEQSPCSAPASSAGGGAPRPPSIFKRRKLAPPAPSR